MIDGIEGIAPRESVFDPSGPGLPGQVFAAEILERPVGLKRDNDGFEITIDRRGVKQAVYTTAGKNELCRKLLAGKNHDAASRIDGKIHEFLTSAGSTALEYPAPSIPLRWASGGVLSVVKWRGSVWSLFFFRDIPPVGWNIAAGSSDTEAELLDPVSFGCREFVEETIVLPKPPELDVSIPAKTFPYIMKDDDGGAFQAAIDSVNAHLEFRSREDGLMLPPFPPGEAEPDRAIGSRHARTKTRLRILDDKNEKRLTDVLVCFNIFELGIEVISVLHYDLQNDDYLLDGEMLMPVGGEAELVRMPVALISHDYLSEVFGRGTGDLHYESPMLVSYDAAMDVWKQTRSGQPSIRPARPPVPGEIVVFDWDIQRRKELSKAGTLSDQSWKAEPMRIRHRTWVKTFSRYFEPDRSGNAPRHTYPFFTAAAAKTIAYYFRQETGS